MNNMADLFGKMNEMQEKMQGMNDKLANETTTAEAGGGMVKVTANGNNKIVKIELDKDVVDPEDTEMLEDLVVAGVNKALDQAEDMKKEKMAEFTKDMLPGGGIPGMDLSKLGL